VTGNRCHSPFFGNRGQTPFFAALLMLLGCPALAEVVYPPVGPGVELEFPRDDGSHPAFKLEWWYVTGWLEGADRARQPRGFQVTFFRVRTGIGEDNPSRFAPRQVLFAHAALADPADGGKLRHAQRSGREALDLVYAREGAVDVRLDDWSIRDVGDGRYRTRVRGEDFEFELTLQATQPPLLQGERGFSRKGPDPRAASHYYSLPHLQVSGTVSVGGERESVSGQAWFDHEWSSDYVDERARGWDWMGINLKDGGALMAFRMRDSASGGARWAAATLRRSPAQNATSLAGAGEVKTFEPEEVTWTPLATWRSPRTGVEYPVRWQVKVGATMYRVEPLIQDAELDSRASTGVLYWEGPVRLLDDASGRELGRGYLELTGYGGKLDF
jgi:predicted secreted hydrolase